MIETFTAEDVAAIAAEPDRTPSSNDLFVRYEDHVAALETARHEQSAAPRSELGAPEAAR